MTTDELVRKIRERRALAVREAGAVMMAAIDKMYLYLLPSSPIAVLEDALVEPDVVVEPKKGVE